MSIRIGFCCAVAFGLGGSLFAQSSLSPYTLYGQSPGTGLGGSVSVIGDLDGDGADDFIVGSIPYAFTQPRRVTSAWVYSGRAGTLLYSYTGSTVVDEFGYGVAGAGDTNGDGTPDFAITSLLHPVSGSVMGVLEIYSGVDGALLVSTTYPNPNTNLTPYARRVDGMGDVNQDGFDDLIVAGGDGMMLLSGLDGSLLFHTYVGFQLRTGPRSLDDLDGDGIREFSVSFIDEAPQTIRSGVDGHELFGVGGSTITTIADSDGDGVPELLVGFPHRMNSPLPGGKVEVLSGADLSRLQIYRSTVATSNLGSEVVAMGDVDSDGMDDFAFGESGDSTLGTQLGSVQIRSGATGTLLYRIPGFVQGGTIGGTMAGSCDLNGDGVSDLLLSDPEGTGNGILHPIMVPNPSGFCGVLREEAIENGDACGDAVAIVDGTYFGQYTSVLNRDMFSFRVAPGATVHTHVSWSSNTVRLSSRLWVRSQGQCGISSNPGSALLAQSTSSGRIDWTNPGPGAMDVVLEVAPGFGYECRPYDLVLSGSEPTHFGRNYCRVFPNSTGRGATLAATGSLISQENSMVLTAGFVPDGQAMFFLASPGNGLIHHVAGSSGVLCVGGGSPIARLHSSLGFTSNGQFSAPIDLTQVPLFSSGGYAIQPGETWFFQGWFRDSGTSNFTVGLEVTFL